MLQSRLIVGLVLIAAAILFALFGESDYSTPAVIGLGVLGIIIVARSRHSKKPKL